MQYETIILELLSRIKKLEDDVEMLKKSQSAYDHNSSEKNDDMEVSVMSKQDSSVVYKKMTDEMIDYMAKTIIEAVNQ